MGRRAVLVLALLTVAGSPAIRGQAPLATASPDPPRFRVGVDVVRVDAVVTDRKGEIVRDLKPGEFELYQDGKRQTLVLADFISTAAPAPAASPAGVPGRPASFQPLPPSSSGDARQVQRTIALVVDDLGVSWESLGPTRHALETFVDEQMLPGDLVGVLRTSTFSGSLQQFTSDRRRLRSMIRELSFTAGSRRRVEPFKLTDMAAGAIDELKTDDVGRHGNLAAESNSALATIGALTLIIRGARDLPGRKAVVLLSEGFSLRTEGLFPDPRILQRLDELYDQAARAGVVIYTLDVRGLQTGGAVAGDGVDPAGSRRTALLDSQDSLFVVAQQTGGLAMMNSNDLPRLMKRISDSERGYYILGYTPRDGTFARPGKTARFHRLSIKVTRPGLRVRTRKGFLGFSDDTAAAAPTPQQLTYMAALSPFVVSAIGVRATVLPAFAQGQGNFLRALLHIDPKALSFQREPDGVTRARADVLSLVFDPWGQLVTSRAAAFAAVAATEDHHQEPEAGIVYSLRIPLQRRSGGFQVRFAVRDRRSGALGAAGEYVDVPDARRGSFALSGVVIGDKDAVRLLDDAGLASHAQAAALRRAKAGGNLAYTYEVYNAAGPVQSSVSIWRGNERVFTAPPDKLVPPADSRPFAAAGALELGRNLPAGKYVLEVNATTGKGKSAVQRVAFEVRRP